MLTLFPDPLSLQSGSGNETTMGQGEERKAGGIWCQWDRERREKVVKESNTVSALGWPNYILTHLKCMRTAD